MYILKGFIAFTALADNAVGVIAPIGELSKDSLTYAKESGLYKSDLYPGVLLNSFQSYSSDLGLVPVPEIQSAMALQIGSFFLESALDHRFSSNRSSAFSSIRYAFTDLIDDLTLGEMLTDGEIWMPEWVSYKLKDTQSYTRLWFCDTAFSNQYDSFEYEFIPPIENIDYFFRPRAEGLGLLQQTTLKRVLEQIDVTRGVSPYTLLRTQEYGWVNPEADVPEDDAVNTNWTVLIYGRAGDDPDQIRLALIEWILIRSLHSRIEWLAQFPDIFTPTEFIVMPLWHQFAVPNQTIQSGLNSPMISVERALEVARTFCLGIGYEPSDLLRNTVVAATPYRTLGMLVTGSAVNKRSISDFRKLYPDYIGLPLASPDFVRLSTLTQGWMHMLVNLLVVAESMSAYSVVPASYTRIIRSGVVYAVKEYQGMQYLLVTRGSTIASLGLEAPYEPEFDPYDPDSGCTDLAQLIHDHLTLHNNPHLVTAYQAGLDFVSPVDWMLLNTVTLNSNGFIDGLIESQLDPLWATVEYHVNIAQNPHVVTPFQVGLPSSNIMTLNTVVFEGQQRLAELMGLELDPLWSEVEQHITLAQNPHEVTALQLGLPSSNMLTLSTTLLESEQQLVELVS
jgi:hypothetical protein